MNTLKYIHSIVWVAIAAIVLGPFSLDSKAAAKKTTSRVATKPKSVKQAPETNVREIAAIQAAKKLTPTQKTKMLALLNDGSTGDLEAIRGIGKSRAAALAKARPFKSVAQLVNVRGIGDVVYSDLLAHAKSLTVRRSSPSTARKSSSTAGTKTKSPKPKSN